MTANASGSPVIGAEVAGYKILEEIARGSAGVVYRARQVSLNRIVALKVLLSGAHASEQEVARFYAEAQSVAKLRHPNIVPVYDVGRFNDSHFIAMEFVEGEPLDNALRRKRFSPTDALQIVAPVAHALGCAHASGIVHRDIKPANIMLGADGGVRVMDFGLAKQLEAEVDLTRSGATVGTPNYMSPEQARGDNKNVDARSDLHSLGAVLYELLTGRPPHSDDTNLRVLLKVINDDPIPPRKLNPLIDRDLQTICLKAMEKNKTRRYDSAEALSEDLRRYMAGEAILARPASLGYKFSKSFLRHWRSAAVVLLAILVTGGVVLKFGAAVPPAEIILPAIETTPPPSPRIRFNRFPFFIETFGGNLDHGWTVIRGDANAWQIADQTLSVRSLDQSWIEAKTIFPGDVEISFTLWSAEAVTGRFAVFLGGEGERRKGNFRAEFELGDQGKAITRIVFYHPLGDRFADLPVTIPITVTQKATLTLRRWGNELTVLANGKPVAVATDERLRNARGNFGFGAIRTSLLIADVAGYRLLPPYTTLQETAERNRREGRFAQAEQNYDDLMTLYRDKLDDKARRQALFAKSYCRLGTLGLFSNRNTLDSEPINETIQSLTTLASTYRPDRGSDPTAARALALEADLLIGTCLVRISTNNDLGPLSRQVDRVIGLYKLDRGEVLDRMLPHPPLPDAWVESFWETLAKRQDVPQSEIDLYVAAITRQIQKNESEGDFIQASAEAIKLSDFYRRQRNDPEASNRAIEVLKSALTYKNYTDFPLPQQGLLHNKLGNAYLEKRDLRNALSSFSKVLVRLRVTGEQLLAAEADLGIATVAVLQNRHNTVIAHISESISLEVTEEEPKNPEPSPEKPAHPHPGMTPEQKGEWLDYEQRQRQWDERNQLWMKEHADAILKWVAFKIRYDEIYRRMRHMLAEAYRRKGAYDQAIRPLREIVENQDESRKEQVRALRLLGDVQRYSKQYNKAQATYQQVLHMATGLRSDCALARLRLGETLTLEKKYEEAADQFLFLEDPYYEEEIPRRLDAHNKRALTLLLHAIQPGISDAIRQQRLREATELWAKLPYKFTSPGELDPNLKVASLMAGGSVEAFIAYIQTVKPRQQPVLFNWLGIHLEQNHDLARAKEAYARALQSDPQSGEWFAVWARQRIQEVADDSDS